MAHNLYNNIMAFHGELPWHGLGVQFDELMTAEQAFEAAQLNYEVVKEPVYRRFGDNLIAVPDKYITVNMDNQEILGLVGSRYHILQNKDAVEFFDAIMGDTGARFHTAGALGNGEKMWLLAKLPDSYEPLMGDLIDKYLLFTHAHDGTWEIQARFTDIRAVCQNTVTAGMKGTKEFMSLKHTAGARDRLAFVGQLMKDMNDHFAAKKEVFQEFAAFRIDDDWIEAYEENIFGPTPTNAVHGRTQNLYQRKVRAFEQNLMGGMGVEIPGVRGTAWGAYNAMIEFADYDYPMRESTDRVQSILAGTIHDFKQEVFDTTLAMVRV